MASTTDHTAGPDHGPLDLPRSWTRPDRPRHGPATLGFVRGLVTGDAVAWNELGWEPIGDADAPVTPDTCPCCMGDASIWVEELNVEFACLLCHHGSVRHPG